MRLDAAFVLVSSRNLDHLGCSVNLKIGHDLFELRLEELVTLVEDDLVDLDWEDSCDAYRLDVLGFIASVASDTLVVGAVVPSAVDDGISPAVVCLSRCGEVIPPIFVEDLVPVATAAEDVILVESDEVFPSLLSSAAFKMDAWLMEVLVGEGDSGLVAATQPLVVVSYTPVLPSASAYVIKKISKRSSILVTPTRSSCRVRKFTSKAASLKHVSK